jgi:hypothetical protein
MSPSTLLTTIERIVKLIDEVPEEFVLDVQTALNKVFAHRLAAGSVIYPQNSHMITLSISCNIAECWPQEEESDEISTNDQESKPLTKKRRTKVSLIIICQAHRS